MIPPKIATCTDGGSETRHLAITLVFALHPSPAGRLFSNLLIVDRKRVSRPFEPPLGTRSSMPNIRARPRHADVKNCECHPSSLSRQGDLGNRSIPDRPDSTAYEHRDRREAWACVLEAQGLCHSCADLAQAAFSYMSRHTGGATHHPFNLSTPTDTVFCTGRSVRIS